MFAHLSTLKESTPPKAPNLLLKKLTFKPDTISKHLKMFVMISTFAMLSSSKKTISFTFPLLSYFHSEQACLIKSLNPSLKY